MNHFWKPQYKWQLVDWLSIKYPNNKKEFKIYNKNRLYAIYYSIRNKEE
jgi:hypothetical protein